MVNRYEALKKIHSDIYQCQVCVGVPNGTIKPDPDKVVRRTIERSLDSDIFVVGQSLAATQVRFTGVPFHSFTEDEEANVLSMSNAGRFLNNHFAKIGYTLDPSDYDHNYVYTTDLVQCFPGRKQNGNGDKSPKKHEIENCLPWFLRELNIIQPKVILLLGTPAAKAFYRHLLGSQVRTSRELYGKIAKYNPKDHLHDAMPTSRPISVFVLPHPASMVKDKSAIYEHSFEAIAKSLTES